MGRQPRDLLWVGTRVLLTGGSGFLGRRLSDLLNRMGANVYVPRFHTFDLRDPRDTEMVFTRCRPDLVIHAAARCGGIGANQARPGDFIRDNLQMGINVLETARIHATPRVVVVGTVCEYPKATPVPFNEGKLWDGFPEESNAPYAVAKRALLEMGRAYRKQWGLDVVHVLPTNMYGPGDNFDLKTSHVLPAIIRKIDRALELKETVVTLWGTGRATRDFMHVDDGALGIVLAAEDLKGPNPINLGTGREYSIGQLAQLVSVEMGWNGQFLWDRTMPDGQPRRVLNTNAAKNVLGFEASIGLEWGVRDTIKWWREQER